MKRTTWLYTLLVAALLISACQAKSPSLAPIPPEPPPPPSPETFEQVQGQKAAKKGETVPKVDILFVVDDSGSMDQHQQDLINSISEFTKNFADDKIIDFHIGVVAVYDSVRYGSIVKSDRFDPLGELRPLSVAADKSALLGKSEPRWVTRREGFVDILKSTLHVPVSPYVAKDNPEKGEIANGPEYEELFSPVVAVLDKAKDSAQSNYGFRRKEAHLAIIFVTDANDSSQLYNAEWMAEYLRNESGDKSGRKLSTFGLLIPSSLGDKPAGCKRDPSGKPEKIEKLLTLTKGKVLNLCKASDATLIGQMGKDLREKILGRVEIPLDRIPEEGSCKVSFGSKELLQGENPGWTYGWNFNTPLLVVHGVDKLPAEEGASFKHDCTAVDLSRDKKSSAY